MDSPRCAGDRSHRSQHDPTTLALKAACGSGIDGRRLAESWLCADRAPGKTLCAIRRAPDLARVFASCDCQNVPDRQFRAASSAMRSTERYGLTTLDPKRTIPAPDRSRDRLRSFSS
jgi:hypothetical protein